MKLYWGRAPKEATELVGAQHLTFDFKKIQIYGGLFALLVALPLAYLAWRAAWPNAVIFGVFKEGPFTFLGLLVGIIVAHELCHLLAQPWLGLGPRSYAGFDPKSGSPFAGYRGIVGRPLLLWMLLAPFLALSVVPYLLAPHFPSAAPYLAWTSIVNALGAVGDFFYAGLVLFKLPKNVVFQDGSYGQRAAA